MAPLRTMSGTSSGKQTDRAEQHTSSGRRQCQIVGCCIDLQALDKPYCMKKRACPEHLRAPAVELPGRKGLWRFCNQCGTFQDVASFDDGRRSCRVRLELRRTAQTQQGARQNAAAVKRRVSDSADASTDCTSDTSRGRHGSGAPRSKKACTEAPQQARFASTSETAAAAWPAAGEDKTASVGLLPAAAGSGTWQLPCDTPTGGASATDCYQQQMVATEEALVEVLLAPSCETAAPCWGASLAERSAGECEARVAQLVHAAAEFAGTISAMREPQQAASDCCPMKQQLVDELVAALFAEAEDELGQGCMHACAAATPTFGGAPLAPLPSPASVASEPCPPHVLASMACAPGAVSAAGPPPPKKLAGRMAALQHSLATMAAQLQQLEGFVQVAAQQMAAPGTCPTFADALDRQASRASCATHLA